MSKISQWFDRIALYLSTPIPNRPMDSWFDQQHEFNELQIKRLEAILARVKESKAEREERK